MFNVHAMPIFFASCIFMFHTCRVVSAAEGEWALRCLAGRVVECGKGTVFTVALGVFKKKKVT